MARGFESKDVEYQQSEAQRGAVSGRPESSLSAADRADATRRQTATLALARIRGDLRTAVQPAHRRMLEQAMAALEAELARP